MDRDIESNDPRHVQQERNMPSRPIPLPELTPRLSREPAALQERGYVYQLSESDRGTLTDIGRFRTVALEDLLTTRYAGQRDVGEADLRRLAAQGLVQFRSVWTDAKTGRLNLLVLTKRGKQLLEHHGLAGERQRVYSGLVKPAEARHDSAIYRMFRAESRKIVAAGGRIRRVVLDYELKRDVYRPLGKARALPPLEYARRQAEIAHENGLKVVGGKILLPDLRIEYQTRSGAGQSVDLELATEHYRGAMMRGKAAAGFKMYAPQESVSSLSAAFDPEFVAQIFSF